MIRIDSIETVTGPFSMTGEAPKTHIEGYFTAKRLSEFTRSGRPFKFNLDKCGQPKNGYHISGRAIATSSRLLTERGPYVGRYRSVGTIYIGTEEKKKGGSNA